MKTFRLLFSLALVCLISEKVGATHVMGAEIRYSHVAGYLYTIEIHYSTNLDSPADRPELVVSYGDGTTDTIPRISIQDFPDAIQCGGSLRFSVYQGEHTFSGPGVYSITFDDQNRNGGITNVPNSIAQSFCVGATLVINPIIGYNNSVRFENPQYNTIQSGWILEHALNAFDPDGDSLSFELSVPSGINCEPIMGYQFPGPDLTLDPQTGNWQWIASQIGEYNVTITATEWRNGQMVGGSTRDMTVCVTAMIGINEALTPFFNIFPTLTYGPLSIINPTGSSLNIEIVSQHGQVLFQERIEAGENVIDLGSLANGAYVVRILDTAGINVIQRVLKQ